MPPRSTGLPQADARDDFLRARRRGQLARLLAFLRREPDDVNMMLPYDEVVQALGRVGVKRLGVQPIPVDSIVGSVDRTREFDRSFRPASSKVRARWERIAEARRRGEPFPAIDVLRVGQVHFVRDGHHRVSVARALGDDTINAHVTEVITRVGAEQSLHLGDLPTKSHERIFHERVPLPREARARIQLTDPFDFSDLAEAVEAWGFRATQHAREFIDREELARRWFDEEYVPAVELLREAGMIDGRGTETDAYMALSSERYRLLQSHEWSGEAIDRVRQGG
jgi:hypothetical protein